MNISGVIKEEMIKIIQEDIENNGPIMNILKSNFYCKVGEYDPAGHDEIKILGYVPISCKNCEKFKEFKSILF